MGSGNSDDDNYDALWLWITELALASVTFFLTHIIMYILHHKCGKLIHEMNTLYVAYH